LAGSAEDPDVFIKILDQRYKEYRVWAFENMVEAPETELWTRWMLPDYPGERISAVADKLALQYRQSKGRRVNAEGSVETIIELYNRGYVLGLISNVITQREIPDWLEADGLTKYFKSVLLSSVFGKRKPDPSIYLEAARRAEVEPIRCAYIGDNCIRDVEGTRNAGFGMVVILPSGEDSDKTPTAEQIPDIFIKSLSELLDIFPPRTHSVIAN
jgi:HAD superfamily hydrolase (TIGR01549 family)